MWDFWDELACPTLCKKPISSEKKEVKAEEVIDEKKKT